MGVGDEDEAQSETPEDEEPFNAMLQTLPVSGGRLVVEESGRSRTVLDTTTALSHAAEANTMGPLSGESDDRQLDIFENVLLPYLAAAWGDKASFYRALLVSEPLRKAAMEADQRELQSTDKAKRSEKQRDKAKKRMIPRPFYNAKGDIIRAAEKIYAEKKGESVKQLGPDDWLWGMWTEVARSLGFDTKKTSDAGDLCLRLYEEEYGFTFRRKKRKRVERSTTKNSFAKTSRSFDSNSNQFPSRQAPSIEIDIVDPTRHAPCWNPGMLDNATSSTASPIMLPPATSSMSTMTSSGVLPPPPAATSMSTMTSQPSLRPSDGPT